MAEKKKVHCNHSSTFYILGYMFPLIILITSLFSFWQCQGGEWFHYACVGLTPETRFKGKWYCPTCRLLPQCQWFYIFRILKSSGESFIHVLSASLSQRKRLREILVPVDLINRIKFASTKLSLAEAGLKRKIKLV